ncbi:TetR family transcriptional regulator [Nocardioides sp.]|uniref:TetR family transcriptional regulator n=1 Tax=Nocardioides sp. TaxID=35761 RepID=UPI002735557D|nr:TetR family transcriptional regulator [Nocardioides sp.]MDP3894809.1 TetR family transcriptional regulator [Nocardioides sp.]
MAYRRSDIVERAVALLDQYGLSSLSMRRLGADLGVQPSALYHHFENKQTLLAAVADEILRRGRRPRTGTGWEESVTETCVELRDAMLAYPDGAELVATVFAFGLGAAGPAREIESTLTEAGFEPGLARTATRTVLHFVFGHTTDAQTHLQAGSVGAIGDEPRQGDDFDLGLGLILTGLRTSAAGPVSARP